MGEPLISVCIITYNSSATITETLDSIKNQTYANIELIISDDFSRDETTGIVENWISENTERFSGIKLIKTDKNHGTAINLDTAIRNAHGEWIKILAGDDCLTPDCLSVFKSYTEKIPGVFYICDIEPFSSHSMDIHSIKCTYSYLFHCASFSLKKKIRENLFRLQLAGPAFFFSRNHYLSLFPNIPSYSMLDEWPPVVKTLLSGNDIIPVPEKLVLYRVEGTSLSHQNKSIGNKRMFDENKQFFNDFLKQELLKRGLFLKFLNQKAYYSVRGFQFAHFERTGKVSTFIFRIYQLLPLSIIYKLKQLFWLTFHYSNGDDR